MGNNRIPDPDEREIAEITASDKRKKRKFRSGKTMSVRSIAILTKVFSAVMLIIGIAVIGWIAYTGIQIYLSN